MNKRYKIIKQLGEGAYATVYQALDELKNELVAIKSVNLEPNQGIPATTMREISILKTLNHPNILKFKDTIISETQVCLITEYIEFELPTFLIKYIYDSEDIFNQLIRGLSYLHRNKIIHRDLKPQNILVNRSGIVKIADFGLSVSTKTRMPVYSNDVVTLWYRSPELLNGVRKYSFEVDMWSFGCIMLEILIGEPPFMGKDDLEMLYLIEQFEINSSEWESRLKSINAPEYLIWSILMCLTRNRNKRITAEFLEREYVRK